MSKEEKAYDDICPHGCKSSEEHNARVSGKAWTEDAERRGYNLAIAAVLRNMPHDAPTRWRLRVEALAKK